MKLTPEAWQIKSILAEVGEGVVLSDDEMDAALVLRQAIAIYQALLDCVVAGVQKARYAQGTEDKDPGEVRPEDFVFAGRPLDDRPPSAR